MDVNITLNGRRDPAFALPAPHGAAAAFHRGLPGYEPTPLRAAPILAAAAGVKAVLVKDESHRFGLPAFKVLGASWAAFRALSARLDHASPAPSSLAGLAAALAPQHPLALATATDGNHGRAVARVAAWLGLAARIFVPAGTSAARIAAIGGEGASCTVVDGTYADAVAVAAKEAAHDCVVISDTSWPGYEEVPRWVVEGYSTILAETSAQFGTDRPTVVLVPVGVGSLAAAVVSWYRSPAGTRPGDPAVRLAGVEPATADCVGASIRAGHLVEVPGPHPSIMTGLNCGLASPQAWPILSAGIDAMVTVDDDVAIAGMRARAEEGVVSGESGAATAGVLAAGGARALGLGPDDVVVVLSTEGATDPDAYAAAVGRRPDEVAATAPETGA
jgi:diaminopropionate ammonia-lyase